MAFHGIGVAASRGLLARDYGSLLSGVSANPAASIARSGKVVRYLSDYRALVRGRQGLEVERSTVPLRVADGGKEKRPVDLRLAQSATGFAPVRPLAGVSIARSAGGGVAVGGDGLRFTLEGAKVTGTALGGQDVFFGDVATDTDAVVTPTISGAELFAVLRSRLSPQELRYRVALPSGAVLQAMSGGAVVSRGGKVLARVLAPTARDAQGSPVAVQMSVVGDELVLSVMHRGRDVAYPVMVDPSIITITESSKGWKFGKMFRGCEEETQVYGKAPGGGSPLIIEGPPRLYPRPKMQFCHEEERQYQIGEANWGWGGPYDFSAIEYDDVSLSATTEPEAGEAVLFYLDSCSEDPRWFNGKPIPSTIIEETPKCKRETNNGVDVELFVGDIYEFTPVTVSFTLSIGAILLHEPWVIAEEGETYGTKNPAEPYRTDCLTGRPVNCATGDQVESQTDLRVGGRGSGLSLTRTYNSRLAAKQTEHGPFGFGWAMPYSAGFETKAICKGLECPEEFGVVTQDNGSTVEFERQAMPRTEWRPVGPLVQAKLVLGVNGQEYTLPDQSKLTFGSAGRLESETDRNGNTTTMNRGEAGRLESVMDAAGRKITFAYNSEGLIESAKDPLGDTVKYGYESGNLVSVTEPGESSPRWQFKYNSSHEMIGETDGLGHTTTTEYDALHHVISQTDPMKRTRTWKYVGVPESEDTETIIREPNGTLTKEVFNNQDLPVSVARATETIYAQTLYAYDLNYNLVEVNDPDRHITTYAYDPAGDRTGETNADGDQTKWAYDAAHDVISITNPLLETTTIKRDSHGNVETISRPAPYSTTQTTRYKYDSHGDLESVTNPLERMWSYEYDSNGDRSGETDPAGDKRTWGYNEDSQETSAVAPRGNVKGEEASKYTTKTERDAQGRPLTVTDPLGRATKYAYDAAGDLESVADPNGHKTKYAYDADNEPIKVVEPNGAVTETGYDNAGQVISQTDGNGHTTEYVRNELEEATEATDPLGRKKDSGYDDAGNLTSMYNPVSGVGIGYEYDPANRLTNIFYGDEKTPNVKYEHDATGDVTSMTDGTGTTSYEYDKLGRLVRTTNGHGEIIGYGYDLANEQTKLTYPNSQSITRGYDKDGRLQTVTDWLGHQTKLSYDPDSNLTATTFPTGTTDQDKYAYDNAEELSEVKMTKGTETLASLAYTRDNDGQVKTTVAKGLPGEEKTGYAYDSNNRLIKAGATVYGYDAADNPIKLGASVYTYDSADQLKTGTGVRFEYSEEGERVKGAPGATATTYEHDLAANLIAVERPAEGKTPQIKDTYAYDGNNLRASQTIAGKTTHMAWDTAEGLPLPLSDGTNSYIYGPDGLPIEQINTSQGKVLYLHHDQQGSTRLLTSSTGANEGTATFDAYGNTTGTKGAATTPLGYDGQYTSADTGLVYLRARVYDPATAQFLSVDPLAAETGAPYDYVADNPLNVSDPSGLLCILNFIHVGPSCSEVGQALEPLNPVKYYEEEIESYENGCGYFASVAHGLEGAVVGVLDASGAGEEEAAGAAADEGISATAHGAEQLAERGFTGADIALTRSGEALTQADGATVYLKEVASGRFNIIIEGSRGIVTALKNIPQGAVDRLAANYGWH